MANPSTMNRRVEDAIEELTVQQVLLSSLEGQTWDGVEEERNIVLRNIERLKGRIKKLRREAQAQEHTDEKTGESCPFMICIMCVA